MDEMRSLADLLDLQHLDSDIDRLLETRQSLPELEQYRVAAEESDRAAAALAEAEESLRSTELAVDRADGELKIMEERVRQTERRLFAGGMSARETENMRLDVEMLRKQQSELETAVLEGLERRDALTEAVEKASRAASQARDRRQALESVIAAAWKEIDAALAVNETKKKDLLPVVDRDLLELYERLRDIKEGVAVGALEVGVCGGCHLKLSAAELEEALSAHPPRCTHCRRILVP